MNAVALEIERVARESYGRLVAYLAADTRDVQAAEDFLSDAFVRALKRWPTDGLPRAPEAWLLAVARHRHLDTLRRDQHLNRILERLTVDQPDSSDSAFSFPDRRLHLLFACAHPAIAEDVRCPLMLNVVLGLTAERIASALMIKPSAVGQRLVRAKRRLRETGIPFTLPTPEDFPDRIHFVLEAIYGAFGLGWDHLPGAGDPNELSREAIWLGRMMVELCPDEPEALGLLALMLFSEARKPARFDRHGIFVPLEAQDPKAWDQALIDEAERLLRRAGECAKPGPFQWEACIQAVHAERRHGVDPNWEAIRRFYHQINHHAPTLGSRLGEAAAFRADGQPELALAILDSLPKEAALTQPYWVALAETLADLGRFERAHDARMRALQLTENPNVRIFLERRWGSRS